MFELTGPLLNRWLAPFYTGVDTAALASAEFTTLRLRLLKVAARVVESASRIRIAFASACPDADLFRALVLRLKPAPT